MKRDPAAGLFPPATTLLSRAVWYLLEHAHGAVTLGLLGSAPFALLLVLFLREAWETLLISGTTAVALRPLAFGLAGVYLLRFPLRLALARWMAEQRRGGEPSLPRALAFACLQAPAAFYYGALSTLGWMLGSVLLLPFALTLRASLAFHLFAGGDESARQAWREASRVPVVPLGFRMSAVASVMFVGCWLVLGTAPGTALGLAEWLLKLNVTALREVLSLSSPTWLLGSLALSWMAIELIWSVAFGLLAEDWERLSRGSDLLAELQALEARGEVFA